MSLIICPECGTKLRLKAELPPGKRVRCSKCSAAFAPRQEVAQDFEVIDDSEPDPPARVAAKKPASARKAAAADFEVIDDGEPEPPARVAAKKPASARKAASADFEVIDDGEPEPPTHVTAKQSVTARKAAAAEPDVWVDDEVEEAPEKRPVRRRRPAKPVRKRSHFGLLLGLSIGGGLFVLLAVAGLVTVILLMPSKNYRDHEAVVKDGIKLLEELAAVLEGINDPTSARNAAPKLEQLCDRIETLDQREKALPPLTEKEKNRLKEKYEDEAKKLVGRLMSAGLNAGMKCGGDPTFLAAVKKFERLSEKSKTLQK